MVSNLLHRKAEEGQSAQNLPKPTEREREKEKDTSSVQAQREAERKETP